MKEAIGTEQIFSSSGHRIGIKYHYSDGSFREIKRWSKPTKSPKGSTSTKKRNPSKRK